jgi:hypothetical protein
MGVRTTELADGPVDVTDPLAQLLADETTQVSESLDLLRRVSAAGPAAIAATWETYAALIVRVNEAQTKQTPLAHDTEVAGLVLSLCARMFRWGVSDLLRGRVTPTYGYVRQQAEAVALVRLFRSEPGVAHEWYNIRTDAQGRKFHRDHGPKLMALLQQFSGLREAYDKGSSDALHVRIPALLRGFNTSRRPDGNVEFVLLDREVKPEKTEWFLSALDYFLCLQPRLVYELWRGFPETPQDVFPEVAGLAQLAGTFSAALAESRK